MAQLLIITHWNRLSLLSNAMEGTLDELHLINTIILYLSKLKRTPPSTESGNQLFCKQYVRFYTKYLYLLRLLGQFDPKQ